MLVRIFNTGWKETFHKFDPIPNAKTDTNNHGSFSTDNIGMNYDYPEASYAERARILESYKGGPASRMLSDLHVELGARMVDFAGWEMPVQYPAGIIKEHLHTREAAGLFDVSHMGRYVFRGLRALEFLSVATFKADVKEMIKKQSEFDIQ